MDIRITTEHSASSYGQPVILVDGELVDVDPEFTTVLKRFLVVALRDQAQTQAQVTPEEY